MRKAAHTWSAATAARPAARSLSSVSLRSPLGAPPGARASAPAAQGGALHLAAHRRRAACAAVATTEPETHTYQAEVDRLMDMIVHSLYSNREVFLRELVSNASDALDKQRLTGLQRADAYSSGEALEIRIRADKEAHTITIEDTGIGMTREELLSSLGTIARSGTAKFMDALKEKADANLIGQFGVGFYSAFLVAERVEVETKSNDDSKLWAWEAAAGAHSYTVREVPEASLARGTRITLHLKPDAWEYADPARLSALIRQYSEFIAFPIQLWSETTEYEQVEDEEATKAAQEAADKAAAEAGKEAEPVAPITKSQPKVVEAWKVQNDNKPLWLRSPKEVAQDEYAAFFKNTFREFMDPLAHTHFNVEGTVEFSSMLFVPGMAPFDQGEALKSPKSIRLYVKRVFISDEFDDDLLPRYLGFVRGVVDSSDLPLNVSREILQESRVVRAIRKQLVRRTLEMLAEIAGRGDGGKDYDTFWEAFGRNIKLGLIEDSANRGALAKLVRMRSSASGEGTTGLDAYVARKKEGQKHIYYLAADNPAAAASSPYAEALGKRGLEVLYLTEPIDEVAMLNLQEYEGLALTDVTREDLALDDSEDDKKALADAAADLKPLTDYMKKVLGDRVEKVAASNRLTDSPAVVVSSKFGWSANMERVMKAQTMSDDRAADYMRGKRIMEVNPGHPLIKTLRAAVDLDSREARQQVELLYEAASLVGGFSLDSPKDFASRIYSMMAGGQQAGSASSGVDADEIVPPQ